MIAAIHGIGLRSSGSTPDSLRFICIIALLCLFAPALPAFAQYDEEDEFQTLAVEKVGGELFFEARHRRDSDKRTGGTSQEIDTTFIQGLEINTQGHVYHPKFLEWIADVTLGGTENWLEVESGSQSSTNMLLGYNFNAAILREKPVSAQVFARRFNSFIDRSFGQGIEQTNSSEGFELRARGTFPASFRYQHTVIDEDSEFRIDNQESHLFRFDVADMRNDRRITELSFEHEDVARTTETPDTPGSTVDSPDHRNDLQVRNTWKFGPEELPNRLTGQFRFLDRAGVFQNQVTSFDQNLDLAHTPTLTSFYNVGASLNTTDLQETREIFGGAGFRKSIYDSLNITGSIDARDIQYLDGGESSYGGTLGLDYTKRTPIGIYATGLTVSRHYNTEQSDTGSRRFEDRPVTLSGTTFVSLSPTNIVPGSITVTDLAGVPYIEGVDYELQTLGATTQIRRLIGGAIDDPETVLVSFIAVVAVDLQYTSDSLEWTHRITLEHLPAAIYFTFRRFEEQAVSGGDPGNLDLSQSWLAGMEWTFDDLSLTGEYEQREELLTASSTAYRGRATYIRRISRDTVASLSAFYQMLQYDDIETTGGTDDEADFVETYSANASVTTKVSSSLLLRAYGDYNNSRGRQGDTRARIGGNMQWHYGKMDVTLDAYYSIYEQSGSEGETAYLGFKVRRTF